MATKLERIRLNEISGVDEPANRVPGWLIMKSDEQASRLGAPVRLSDGRVVGKVMGRVTKADGMTSLTINWASDEIAALAKQAHIEEHDGAIYLVGGDRPIGVGKALLAGRGVVLS